MELCLRDLVVLHMQLCAGAGQMDFRFLLRTKASPAVAPASLPPPPATQPRSVRLLGFVDIDLSGLSRSNNEVALRVANSADSGSLIQVRLQRRHFAALIHWPFMIRLQHRAPLPCTLQPRARRAQSGCIPEPCSKCARQTSH